jgi:hypothetical protein
MAVAGEGFFGAGRLYFESMHRSSLGVILRRLIAMILVVALGGAPILSQASELLQPGQDNTAAAVAVDTSPDHLLAPIALYPDALLMQVLAASVDSQEVLDAGNWLLENKSLEGAALDAAAKKVGFGAAMTALLHFPDVVDMMCTQLDWTTQLGGAFQADQAGVLASVQRLRAQAVQYGSLKTTPQQTVQTQTDNGKQVIVIQPANPQVVYVPQYNPETVYVSSGPSAGDVVAASLISFGVGMAIGSLFASNNYYYPRWGYGGVYYGGRPWYPAHYAYRPIYGPHWRPAYGYRPPANYPYHRPNYNNNYYNKYRPGGNYNGSNRPGNNVGYNRPGNGNAGNNTRPGNGYNGGNRPVSGNNGNTTRPGNGGGYNKPGNGGNPAPGKPGGDGGATTRPVAGGGTGGSNGGNRPGGNVPGAGNRPGNNVTRPAPDRGYAKPAVQPRPSGGGAARPGGQPQTRPVPQQQTRPAPQQQARPAAQSRPAPAFSAGGSAKSTNAASQRGASSNAARRKK